MKKYLLYWVALVVVVFAACQKELSFELPNTPAEGSLQSEITGDCLPKTVSGAYAVGAALGAANTITLEVNVTKVGTYVVTTDTINGYFFRATGSFTRVGVNSVTLRGSGTPFAAGTNNFVVSFDSTFCDVQVTVTQPGVGTLAGSPNACAPITVAGGYTPGAVMGAGNTATVQVNVTTAGAFTITTDTVAGVWFTYSGALGAGAQPVVLTANGTIPAATTTGDKTFKVKLGTSTCTFPVTVAAPGVATLGGAGGACTPITVNGTYNTGTALGAGNTIVVNVTVTTPGVFNITTNTVNGYSYAFSGNIAATGPITLTGTGTPIAAGTDNFTVTLAGTPASTCTFSNTVNAAGVAVYTVDCASAIQDGLFEQGTQLNASNTVDITVNVTTIGTYSITTTAVNGMTFSSGPGTFTVTGPQTVTLNATGTPTTAGNNTITVPGTTPCTFDVVVDPPLPTYHWQFTVTNAPSTIYRGENDFVYPPGSNPPIPGYSFVLLGSNALGSDVLGIILVDIDGAINNGETYSTSATITNAAAFSYELPTPLTDIYSADPSITGATMTFTVTNHNVGAKTITGTFSGTAKNSAGQVITITTGTFTATYP